MEPKRVLVVLFEGFNTMDMNGPYEVFRMADNRNAFTVTITAEMEVTRSFEGVQVKRDIALDHNLLGLLGDFDVLVVPGGPTHLVELHAAKMGDFMKLIAAFNKLALEDNTVPKTLLSICTGALFLGYMGIFNGRKCTTHRGAYRSLQKVNMDAAAGQDVAGQVIQARYVDAGSNEYGTRIISSGGVSCGLDASLYVVEIYDGIETAYGVADILDYKWRNTEGFVVAQ
ncbi:hypothetical protein MHUMG1_03650 [Metarhizium humberi]|uniref:DJ-1/PfpI domain-containing protein n=1 Tax=Metarhizium humberi TaxID=2596975 RepID=A0A9P8S8V0_9HYPO|nr:hypothetical protein MHUMG1_03650 [Metarhizium humberi]